MAQLESEFAVFWISALPADSWTVYSGKAEEGNYCQDESQHLQKALDKLAG